ncbi:DUF6916 family protein [Nocardioides abyssi]|uniref:DUF6916 domain-containing protein n=1 Tax=Nocardioides abyssi TaxID=3058370 RepID=A0ABT8EYS4_9ACTN|nr:hypothetical protein [Nocardioides abyssi]MDN4163325.1 hypothetical protein [Nocardioides abyssi]
MISLDRRTLLVGAGAAAVVGAVGTSTGIVHELTGAPAYAAVRPVRSRLAPHLGRRFTTRHDGRTVALVLREVTDLDAGTRGGGPADPETTFRARFETSEELPQGSYRLRRTGYGESDVFLVAGPRESGGTSLTGTFVGAPDPAGAAR